MWRISCNLALLVEPFSWTAFFISLALSAASYAVQRFLGPKPPKAVRGQMQGDLFIQNADEGSPIVEIYGGAPGTAVNKITWTGLTNTRVNADNSLEKISGADNCFTNASGSGDGGARSVETVTSGDWELSFSFDSVTEGRGFGGLTTNGSFTTDYTQLNYCIHVSDQNNTSGTPHPPHSIFIYESGSGRSISASLQDGTYTAGDTLRIQCVSGVVKYYHKQNLLYTSGVAPSYPMRVGASLACLNKTIDGVTLTTASVDTKGGIKTAGTVVWCKPPRKVVTKEKKGGKGMPKQTVETITYYTDLAILFGRGRLRLKKLWTNADLVLDLDAGIGSATGVVDPGSSGSTTYSQSTPPSATSADNAPNTFWGIRLTTDQNGTMSGSVGAGGGASMRWYEGNYDQLPDSLIQSDVGSANAPAYRGMAMLVIENFNISKYGGVPTFLATVENMDYDDLAEIANHLCDRVGIEPQDRDFSVFDGQAVRGLIVQQPQAPRQTLEMASIPYQAQFYESVDGLLTGCYLGGSSVVTINPDHLGMQDGDAVSTEGMGNLLEFSVLADDQLPRQLNVTAFDPFKDHESVTQAAYRMTGFSQGIENMSLPMALSPDETRQSAERLLYMRHVERENAALKLPWRYGYLNPTDIAEVESGNLTHRLRVGTINGAMPGVLEMQCAADEQEIYSQSIAGTSGDGYTAPTVSVPVESIALLVDSVMLRDTDDRAGYYAAIAPKSSSANWGGAVLYRDRGAGYEVVERFPAQAIAGVTNGSVTSQDEAVWDETTTITVDLYGTDATLESVTESEVLNGANAAIIGDNQVIQFQNAVQVGGYDNRWTLSRILWGRRGSDHSAGTYASGSRFLLLDGAVLFVENSLTELAIARDFKAVTAGFSISDTANTSFTWNANGLKPLSVVDVQSSRDGSNNLTVTWVRRSRLGHETPYAGADLPLGEQYERYELDVMNGSTVVRTITVNDATTASYTAADQTTDFGSPQASLTIKIYQISATVGRGFERSATV